MKVEVNSEGGLLLTEVYSGLVLETAEGNQLAVCMRDDTVEMQVVGTGRWFRANMGTGAIEELSSKATVYPVDESGALACLEAIEALHGTADRAHAQGWMDSLNAQSKSQ